MKIRLALLLAATLCVALAAGWWISESRERSAPSAPPESGVPSSSQRGLSAGGSAPVRPEVSPPPEPTGPISTAVAPGVPMVRTTPAASPPPVVHVVAPTPAPPIGQEWRVDAGRDLDAVRYMLRDFRTRLGENPVGSNAEITRALMGRNEANLILPLPAGHRLNDQGELLDRWGTPYFFHQLSSTSMEVRSAGPDAQLYTPDDVVAK